MDLRTLILRDVDPGFEFDQSVPENRERGDYASAEA
jgi:hypothetical protein